MAEEHNLDNVGHGNLGEPDSPRASFHTVATRPPEINPPGSVRDVSPMGVRTEPGYGREDPPEGIRAARGRTGGEPETGRDGPVDHRTPKESKIKSVPPWMNVIYPFIIAMNTKGIHLAFGIFLFQYKHDLLKANSYFQIAWIGSIQMGGILCTTPFVRMLLKKTHHYRLCFIIGGVGLVVGLFAASVCTSLLGFLLTQGVLLGVSTGIIYNAGVMYLNFHFKKWLGVNNTINSTGSSVGGTLFVVIAKYSIPGIKIQWALRIFGFISLATMLPICLTPHKWMNPRESLRSQESRIARLSFERVSQGGSFLVMLGGMLFAYAGLGYGFYFIVTFGYDAAQLSLSDAANLLIVMNACQSAGHFVADTMKDALNMPVIILIPAAFCASQVIFMQIGMDTRAGLYVFACFYGFYSAEIESIHVRAIFTQLNEAAYTSEARARMNLRMNVSYGVMATGALLGPPIAGLLIGHHRDGEFLLAQLFSGFCLLFASTLFYISVVLHLDRTPQNWTAFWKYATSKRL